MINVRQLLRCPGVGSNGFRRTIVVAATLVLSACGGEEPDDLGVHGMTLSPCPSSPNCVSSDAEDADHSVEPFRLAMDPIEAWRVVREVIDEQPRTIVITEAPEYLHVESRSAVFRFVDDLELQLRAEEGIIAVRSASRVGYSDLGANRRRVERLRAALAARGVISVDGGPAPGALLGSAVNL